MHRHTLLYRRSFISKLISWTGALALIGALSVSSFSTVSVSASATTVPLCTTNNLVVWLNTSGSGAAGSSYYSLNFTNLSAHTCTLQGYPGVSGVSQTGIQLGSSAQRDAAHVAATITLTSARSARGLEDSTSHNTATAILQITDAENFPTSACSVITGAGLRVYPPGQKESTVIPYPFVACAKSGPLYLHVEALQRYVATQ
jgi:predicted extracellular nuclease